MLFVLILAFPKFFKWPQLLCWGLSVLDRAYPEWVWGDGENNGGIDATGKRAQNNDLAFPLVARALCFSLQINEFIDILPSHKFCCAILRRGSGTAKCQSALRLIATSFSAARKLSPLALKAWASEFQVTTSLIAEAWTSCSLLAFCLMLGSSSSPFADLNFFRNSVRLTSQRLALATTLKLDPRGPRQSLDQSLFSSLVKKNSFGTHCFNSDQQVRVLGSCL